MSKKARRGRKPASRSRVDRATPEPAITPPLPERRVGAVREPPLPVAEQKQAAAAAMAERKQESAEQFEREYAYVVRDLQYIFALAAIMFILLIVLNLLLR